MCPQSQIQQRFFFFFRNSGNTYYGWSFKIFSCNPVCIIQRECIIHALFKEKHFALTLHM